MLRAVARDQSVVRTLSQSAVSVSAGADTDENVLATITIPAGSMGNNGSLRIWSSWTVTNNANSKTLRARLGGAAGTVVMTQDPANQAIFNDLTMVSNRGASNSQISSKANNAALLNGGLGAIGGAFAFQTASIDTSADTTLVLTGQKADAGDTLTLEMYVVEIIYAE